jgi:DNA-binding PadR family transcriptional regulator
MRHDGVRHNQPLSEPVLLILLSLAAEPRHGYAILKDVAELSGDRVRMSTGTLYGAIRRLLDDRWIERFREADAPRGRQAYRLTPAGQHVAVEEMRRMKLLARLATLRLAGTEH